MLRRAEVAKLVRLTTETLHEGYNKPGFADPRLTGEQYHAPLATLRLEPALREVAQLLISSQQRHQGCRRMERFGAAAVSRSRHLPSRNLLSESPQIKGS